MSRASGTCTFRCWTPKVSDATALTGIGSLVTNDPSIGDGPLGLITDAALCPEPQAIIDRFEPEFQKLLMLAMMLPWGEDSGLAA